MKLVIDWRAVLLRSYSMWSMYLGLLCLVAPNALYGFWQIESDPYLIGKAAFVFFGAGIFGRVIDQDHSDWLARWVFIGSFAYGALMLGLSIGGAVAEDFYLPEEPASINSDEQAGLLIPAMGNPSSLSVVSSGIASNDEFLEVAVPFVAKWEGLRLKSYRDIVGVWTVCYGETKGVTGGMAFSKAQCDAMLARELLSYRKNLHRYFSPETLKARLPVTRDTAYTSLAYNVGYSGAGKSTAVRRLNAGNVVGGCNAITWWNKAGGRVVRGLSNRRAEDYGMCMVGVA